MPDHDVYTEHDPREPVVGHAHVDDDAVADPDAEPVSAEAVADGSATTYESAAHDDHDTADDSYIEGTSADETAGRAEDADTEYEGRQFTDGEHGREADEATAGENGFGDRSASDETFRDRAADDATFGHETHADTVVTETPDDTVVERTTHEVDVDGDTVVDHTTDHTGTLDYEADADRAHDEALADGSAVDDPAVDHVTADDADSDATGLTYTGDAANLDTATPAGAEAAAPPVQAAPDLKPGAVDSSSLGKLWADADVDGLRGRWRELQLKFIDDPQEVAGEAQHLVAQAVDALTAALNSRKDALSEGVSGDDTEQLRAAVRRYRDFFDQLLKL